MSKKCSKLGALISGLACLGGMGGNFVSNASTLYDADWESSVSRTYCPRRSCSNMDISGAANTLSFGLDLLQLMCNEDVPGWLKGVVAVPGVYALTELSSMSLSGKLLLTPKVVRALGGTWEEGENGDEVLVSEKHSVKIRGKIDKDGNFYLK